ncbi:MAG: hybrid sensor histidine kinase/response regulator [Chloroflexota bacterium]
MDDAELLKLFWTEVREYLDTMNQYVMALEMSVPEEDAGAFVERLRELNRLAHSMKGAARAVGVKNVETIGHHLEDVFEAALQRGLGITPEIADLLYDALDIVQQEASGDDVDADVLATVIEQLEHEVQTNVTLDADNDHDPKAGAMPAQRQILPEHPDDPRESDTFHAIHVNGGSQNGEIPAAQSEPPAPPPPQPEAPRSTPPAPEPADDAEAVAPFFNRRSPSMTQTMLVRPAEDTVRVSVDKLDRLMQESSELLVTRLQSEERKHDIDRLRRDHGRWAREWRTVRTAYIRLARRLQTADDGESEDLRDLLEFLETNQRYLADTARSVSQLAGGVANDTMRLSALTDSIQDSISSLRLVPFDSILGTLHRTLRDASRETGKEAFLDVMGSSTEIDKAVLEYLKDPIMHLIRNAVDHGIETPAERQATDKPESGWVYLNVEQRGGEIVIMVSDDGRGIAGTELRDRALKAGIINQSVARNMTEDDMRALIFHPGLTTKDSVSAISGRGVGMDVVRDRVESLRGRISITSRPGQGTVFVVSVPVSLTRIRSVMMELGNETYAVPSLSVLRMERLSRDEIFTAEGRPVIKIGARTLPLVNLGDMLGVPMLGPLDRDGPLRVIVLDAADRQVAFEVDALESERELVLKPLGDELANTRYVSGAALLGGGEVVIVLDANDLVRGATGNALPARRTVSQARQAPDPEAVQKLRVLVADDSITTRTLEKNILETAGCDVRVAFDGLQAWETLSEFPFDVVISDVEMPRMDGLTLTKRIKENPATRHIPVILLTSLNRPEHREAGLRAGADAYLVKSRFDQEELLRTVRAVL